MTCVTMIFSMAACGNNHSGKNEVKSYDSFETVACYKIGAIQNLYQSMIEVIYEAVDDSDITDITIHSVMP